jgi:hypothetical protein
MTHLEDTQCLAPHVAGESHAVRARTLDTKGLDVTERPCPREQLRVASAIGGDAAAGESNAEMIDDHGDVDGLVRINPDDDRGLGRTRRTKLGHVSDSPVG